MVCKSAWPLLFILFMAAPSVGQGRSPQSAAAITTPSIDGILYVDGVRYDGSSDLGATLNNMIKTLPKVGGYAAGKIVIPCGTYPLKSTVVWSSPYLSIEGSGSACTIINSSLNGDAFRIYTDPFTVLQAGSLKGLTINGNSSANSVGVHMGDIISLELNDVVIHGF